MSYDQIQINEHSSIRIGGTKAVYFDPFKVGTEPHDADVICFTHSHYDHFEPESVARVRRPDTVFVAPADMEEQLKDLADEGRRHLLAPGDRLELDGLTITAVPAFNALKPFHPRRHHWLGYLLEMDGVCYYVAGDTDAVKELRTIKCDVALVPVGGTYTMTAKEAAGLINEIRPQAAIPTHYGSIVGAPEDGETFRRLVDPTIEVVTKL